MMARLSLNEGHALRHRLSLDGRHMPTPPMAIPEAEIEMAMHEEELMRRSGNLAAAHEHMSFLARMRGSMF